MSSIGAAIRKTYFDSLFGGVTFLLTFVGVVVSTYVSGIVNLLAVLMLPAILLPGAWAALRAQPAMLLFAFAFLLLAGAFGLNSEAPADMLYVFNFVTLLLAAPVYVIAAQKSGRERTLTLLAFCVGGSAIAFALGLFDVFARGLERAEGFYTGALIYARLALMLGFIGGAGFFLVSGSRRLLFALGPLLGIVATLLAGARGVLVAAPFLIVVFLAFALTDRSNKHRWWLALAVLGIGALAIVAALVFVHPERIVSMFDVVGKVASGDGGDADTSTQLRLSYYGAAWELFMRQPLLGYGWADFQQAAYTILNPAEIGPISSFHNDFLNFAVGAGLLGLVALGCIWIAPLAGALSAPRDALTRPRLYCATVLVVLYLVSGLTDITFGYDMPTTAYAIMTALILGLMRERPLLA